MFEPSFSRNHYPSKFREIREVWSGSLCDQNPYRKAGAIFSRFGEYRFGLWRYWKEPREDDSLSLVAFIGLNPSTADELTLDNTLNRCRSFALSWGFEGFIMLNVNPLVSTDPKGMRRVDITFQREWSENLTVIRFGVTQAQHVVCCWGDSGQKNDPHWDRRLRDVKDVLRPLGDKFSCFGTTKSGSPKHPLYLKAGTARQRFLID